jgi:serine/threonine-protein kinase
MQGKMRDSLTEICAIDVDIERYLGQIGKVFRAFREQDSGCLSYGVLIQGGRWFVKHSDEPRGIASLRRAFHLNSTVQHPALPRLHNSFDSPGGFALVYEWVPGYLWRELRHPSEEWPAGDADSPYSRFRGLTTVKILDALDTIYDVHLLLADRGFVAVDFYDGCIIYDFNRSRTYLCDLDEYRDGPFNLDVDRLPGSRRFMAPEEWQRGARIDQVTNVFTLGRTALVLLGDGSGSMEVWKGNEALKDVVTRATALERMQRHQTVREFVEDWRCAVRANGVKGF